MNEFRVTIVHYSYSFTSVAAYCAFHIQLAARALRPAAALITTLCAIPGDRTSPAIAAYVFTLAGSSAAFIRITWNTEISELTTELKTHYRSRTRKC